MPRPCGRSPRGERGLKSNSIGQQLPILRRSPRGERGLKFHHLVQVGLIMQSLPSRGAWIEIFVGSRPPVMSLGRSPRGERGLKLWQPLENYL